MSDIRLTPTSYVVLGLLDRVGPATPYDLKRRVGTGLGNFWSFPHTQLYTEPERLAAAGYLDEERETGGRRRKLYSITAKGRKALREWLGEPTGELTELRDVGLLKIFLGADPASLADMQLAAHRAKLAEYEEIRKSDPGGREELLRGPRITLDVGIAAEKQWIRFWEQMARDGG